MSWLDTATSRSPAQWIFHRRASHQLTVLAYHGIEEAELFAQQMDYLLKVTVPVSLHDVLDALAGRSGLPKHAVLLTFDDGERSVLEHGLPLLQKRGLPGVVFVVSGVLDTDLPFWWSEVEVLQACGGRTNEFAGALGEELVRTLKQVPNRQRLVALDELRQSAGNVMTSTPQLRRQELSLFERAGIAVGNHSWSHPCLPNCTVEEIHRELTEAHDYLAKALGHHPRVFAYPNGDADVQTERLLLELGYEAAFLFDHRLSPMPPSNPMRISRVRVDSSTSLDRFKIIVSGLHPAIHHARGRK